MDDHRTLATAGALIDRRLTILGGGGPILDGRHLGQPLGARTVEINGHQLFSRIVHDTNSYFKVEAAKRTGEHGIQRRFFSAAYVPILASRGMKQVKTGAKNH
jgi:hypothetical protein